MVDQNDISDLILKWNLESPSVRPDFQVGATSRIKGWVLSSNYSQTELHLIIRTNCSTYSYPLNQLRKDVVNTLLHDAIEKEKKLLCGFSYEILTTEVQGGVELGFEYDGRILITAILALL